MTKIEWTRGDDGAPGRSWNPVTGCDPIDVTLHPERLDEPLRWRKPPRVFVCSMSDLFHADVPFEFIGQIFARMIPAEQHTFILLTKRPERMLEFTRWFTEKTTLHFSAFRHIWFGVTCENQRTADERIPLLLQTPAAVRWVSYEPALGPVGFENALYELRLTGTFQEKGFHYAEEKRGLLHWIVAGAETGPGARPADPDLFRSVRDQCAAAGVPFFYKRGSDKSRLLDGQKWEQWPG